MAIPSAYASMSSIGNSSASRISKISSYMLNSEANRGPYCSMNIWEDD